MKHCNGCDRERPEADFHRSSASRDGCQSRCKRCHNKWHRENRKPTTKSRAERSAYQRKLIYGLADEDFQRMLADQLGCCKICEKRMSPVCVDHDHQTKRVRGLLCSKCNIALGSLDDSVHIAYNLIRYLEDSL